MNNDLYQFKKPISYSDLFSEDLIHKQAVQPKTVKQSDNGKEIVNEPEKKESKDDKMEKDINIQVEEEKIKEEK